MTWSHFLQPYFHGWSCGFPDDFKRALNPYMALMVEPMHQTDLGIFMHVKKSIIAKYVARKEHGAYLRELERLDERLQEVRTTCRMGGLSIPEGPYFTCDANITASEHRSVFYVIVAISQGMCMLNVKRKCVLPALIRV